ncbi:MAG: cytochrome c biogenesis protein CcdA [Chloroflexi bacterium]|nr:cytochrome c biogenesis protein CcdA [Chloroflexota bacterium]
MILPFGYAFGAGMVTTVSPCGVAMLPAYISLYLGAEEEEFDRRSPLWRGGKAILLGLVVTAGFIILFTIVGTAVALGGRLLFRFIPWVAVLIGVGLLVLGLRLLAGGHVHFRFFSQMASRIGGSSNTGPGGFLLFGIAYGIACLSCTLPLFLVVVGSALALGGVGASLLQFVTYALGKGFVITLITLGTAFFKEGVRHWLRSVVPQVARASALLLVLAGGYILYYWFVVGDILNWTF